MKISFAFLFTFFAFSQLLFGQSFKVLESNGDYIKIEFSFENSYQLSENFINGRKFTSINNGNFAFRKPGEPSLPSFYVNIGVPLAASPQMKIISLQSEKKEDIFILPLSDSINQKFEDLNYDPGVYNSRSFFPKEAAQLEAPFVMRYACISGLLVSPFQFNPATRELIYHKKILVEVRYNAGSQLSKITNQQQKLSGVTDKLTENILSSAVINPDQAKSFLLRETKPAVNFSIGPKGNLTANNWYNPGKDYYKIYLNQKGLYRITFDQLISAGVPGNTGLEEGKLEIVNNGTQIPIEIVDADSNGRFNAGDYFNFIGGPPAPADPYTYFNIYNKENVYWFSFQADSLRLYKNIDGHPGEFNDQIQYTLETIHYEKDLLYERLGYAPDDKRDFWLWDDAEARGGEEYKIFLYWITDSLYYKINEINPQINVRVNMQGITTCGFGISHSAFVKYNSALVGRTTWSGQNSVTFEGSFNIFSSSTPDGIPLSSSQDKFEVGLDGNTCDGNDIVKVNWFELDYWKWNLARGNKYIFKSPPQNIDGNLYYLWQWTADNMKVYVPQRGELITNPYIVNDIDKSVLFADTIKERTEYFCYADDSYMIPDSIIHDNTSDLRNISNGADYIIITHPKFNGVAQRLADFRSRNLPGYSSARVAIVDVFDIYDEFSYGLLTPFALQSFVKYAFENWQTPAPAFVVLLGDMSYDYRPIYQSNRKNFIPSIPYQSYEFGQAPSDNLIAAVAGQPGKENDIIPDLAIGRISCETVEEGNILVDKIINYPADNSKAWKENVLLMGSGISKTDERLLHFNAENLFLEREYLSGNGITASKVFRFPDSSDAGQIPYLGSGPEIRKKFDEGAVLANYYGHGGGGQWDLTFNNDDIYELNNEGRLPLIVSTTCYTAHFDNQDVFGEKFNKVPGKGSIGFYGSSGLTWWQSGVQINKLMFNEIFNNREYVIGNAILKSKLIFPPPGFPLGTQIALLCLLGDPALELALPKFPDFRVQSSDISVTPHNPLAGDTALVKIKISNVGLSFPGDSVSLNLYENSGGNSELTGSAKLPSFGEADSVIFAWVPKQAGLFSIIARVNEDDNVRETDHTDNAASADIAVFSFGAPNVVKPVNGSFSNINQIDFVFSDVGSLFQKNFRYVIEIDTSAAVNSPAKILSPVITANDGIVKWKSPVLNPGEYFWKASIYDESDTNQTEAYIFTIEDETGFGYSAQKKQLKRFGIRNINYSDELNSLVLNTELNPPRPANNRWLDSIRISLADDAKGITAFTTDGSYFYYADLSIYSGQPGSIYKIGTGLNGTQRGRNYGPVPNLVIGVKNTIFSYSDGFLYAATGETNSLLKINPLTGDTSRVTLPDGMLPSEDGLLQNNGFYLCSDGNYVYNLTPGYGGFRNKFVLRTFNPSRGWEKTGEDIVFNGTSDRGFSGFCVVNGFLLTFESYNSGYLRRYRLSDGAFEEEWLSFVPFKDFYTICYDWINNFTYFSTFRPNNFPHTPAFWKFAGTYLDAAGSISTENIGPASKWESVNYNMETSGSTGHYSAALLGKNLNSNNWDTLIVDLPPGSDISGINSKVYNLIKIVFNLVDSSLGASEPLKLRSVLVKYLSLPEISLSQNLNISADTVVQGIPVNVNSKVYNIGYISADSISLRFYGSGSDSILQLKTVSLQPDSSFSFSELIQTGSMIFNSGVKVVASLKTPEFFSFNNIAEKGFYVARDSIRPLFKITFDGHEIGDGDFVSSHPEVVITLSDNGPLPLDTNMFTLIHTFNQDVIPLSFSGPDIQFSYTPYPNSAATIKWTPDFKEQEGEHTLEVLAKDASGNFFDTTSSRTTFFVSNTPQLKNIYNYPNPFKNDTYFTFELSSILPEEIYIKVYTVAGRLIRDFSIPLNDLKPGFNRIYWNGRDQDGDEIANGLYLYRIVAKMSGIVKSSTEKLVKVK